MKTHEARKTRIAVLDREPAILDYISTVLENRFDVTLFSDPDEFTHCLSAGRAPDLLIVDWDLPRNRTEQNAYGLLAQMRSSSPALPFLVFACAPDPGEIALAVSLGQVEFLLKPFSRIDIDEAVRRSLGTGSAQSPGDEVKEIPLNENTSFVRCTPRMQEIETQCTRVARADIPVLILGESGTGKEVAALLIHKSSARSQRMFLKVNCAAMPADLLESELFGYEQGAFTGAVKSKPGKFELCDKGTIFLDEIGEMPAILQAKLLQVLQDGTFSRLGSRSSVRVDVRVIAATNIDVKQAMVQKQFREDLYYRLNGFTVRMPPLRERTQEIPVLAAHFMRKTAAKYDCTALPISPALMRALSQYSWPGNLRELENTIKRYLVLGGEREIIEELSPISSMAYGSVAPEANSSLKTIVAGLKRNAEAIAIAQALAGTGWNRKAAADDLKISYKALLYKIKEYNLMPIPVETALPPRTYSAPEARQMVHSF